MSPFQKELSACCDAVKEITGLSGWDYGAAGDVAEHIYIYIKLQNPSGESTAEKRKEVVDAFKKQHGLQFLWLSNKPDKCSFDIGGHSLEEMRERIEKLRKTGDNFRSVLSFLNPVP